eukprot:4763999-Prymnesium_polylepis.1
MQQSARSADQPLAVQCSQLHAGSSPAAFSENFTATYFSTVHWVPSVPSTSHLYRCSLDPTAGAS